METRPWPIKFFAMFFLFFPFSQLAFDFFSKKIGFIDYFDSLFLATNVSYLFYLFVPSIVLGISIFLVKKWSYFLMISLLSLIILKNSYFYFSESGMGISQYLVGNVFIILILLYFIVSNIKIPFFNPIIRWWENNLRFIFEVPISLTETTSDHGKIITCDILNISRGGMFVNSKTPLIPGSDYKFNFIFKKVKFNGALKVVYKKGTSESYGIQFLIEWKDKNLKRKLKKLCKYLKKIKAFKREPISLANDLNNWLDLNVNSIATAVEESSTIKKKVEKGGGLFIVAIDDEEDFLDILEMNISESLKPDKFVTFSDPLEALEEIREGLNPDVILTDYHMDEMDGVQLAGEIKKIAPHIKVILLTGFSQEFVDKDLTELGLGAVSDKLGGQEQLNELIKSNS